MHRQPEKIKHSLDEELSLQNEDWRNNKPKETNNNTKKETSVQFSNLTTSDSDENKAEENIFDFLTQRKNTSGEESPPLHIKLLTSNDELLYTPYKFKGTTGKLSGTFHASPKQALRLPTQTDPLLDHEAHEWTFDSDIEKKSIQVPTEHKVKINKVVSFRVKRTLPRSFDFSDSMQDSDQEEQSKEPIEMQQLRETEDSTVEVPPVEMAADSDELNVQDTNENVDLMDWWKTVGSWSDWNQVMQIPGNEDKLTIEDAAGRVFMAARLFVSLFNQRGVSLQRRIVELLMLADTADSFHKKTVSAAVGGGVASVAGAIATITGLILAPFTFGTSTIVTAVGISVATAGSITSATANISDAVHSKLDRKKVEKMIQDYQNEISDIRDCLEFLQEGMHTLQEYNFQECADSENVGHSSLGRNIKHVLKEGGRAGKALVINTDRLISTVKVLGVAGGAARAATAISVTMGVMSTLFLALDVFFLAKDSSELRKGAKTKFACKIREICKELQRGLLQLNKVKSQLQKTIDGIELEECEDEDVEESQYEADPNELALLEQELDQLEEKLDQKAAQQILDKSKKL